MSRPRQRNSIGTRAETLSIWFNTFIHYLGYAAKHSSARVVQRDKQEHREVVTISIIEQEVALTIDTIQESNAAIRSSSRMTTN